MQKEFGTSEFSLAKLQQLSINSQDTTAQHFFRRQMREYYFNHFKQTNERFFIPIGQKVWIEFWGLEETKYLKRKELKKKFYTAHNKNLIELTDKDIENLDDNMPIKLRKYLPPTFSFD